MKRLPGMILCLLALSTPAAAQSIEGAWRPVQYHLESGESRDVDGQILFTEDHWSVLFFVLDEGQPGRGSAEAGTYEIDGDRLTFFHTLRLADIDRGSESALVREIKEPTREPTRFEMPGDRLTIHFPSGNRMVFRRLGQ